MNNANYFLWTCFLGLILDVSVPLFLFSFLFLQGPSGPPGLQGPLGAPGVAVSILLVMHNKLELFLIIYTKASDIVN